jgi:hypothetical protein
MQVSNTNDWNMKVLLHGDNTYLLPVSNKLIVKRMKDFDMQRGVATLNYTHVLWIRCKGAPKEVVDKLKKEIKYRIGFSEEEKLTDDTSNIRL